jgi:hypothetical protein
MIVDRAIRVRGDREGLLRVIDNVTATLTGGWVRDDKAEKELRERGSETFCFEAPETKEHPHGYLGLHLKPTELVASNPGYSYWHDGRRRWSKPRDEADEIDRRNRILLGFYERFLVPLSADLGVEATISDGLFHLEHYLGAETIRNLVGWARWWCPPSSNQVAEGCWVDFLVGAHREGARLDPWLLRRWIAEEWRIPVEEANRRLAEYKTARALLLSYQNGLPGQLAVLR